MGDPGELRGERVTLRHMVRADVDHMASWPRFHEPELRWANLDLAFPTERDAYFERGRTSSTRRRFVILDERDNLIGTVGLRNVDLNAGEGTLGIIIRADAVDRGYGTDAVQTILSYAFDVLDLKRVLLDVAESNSRARHVYQNLGFVPFGEHPGPLGVPYVDMVLSRSAFERRRQRVASRDDGFADPAVR